MELLAYISLTFSVSYSSKFRLVQSFMQHSLQRRCLSQHKKFIHEDHILSVVCLTIFQCDFLSEGSHPDPHQSPDHSGP